MISDVPKFMPQQHYEVQSCCGCSPVGVGAQHVPVAGVLGTSDLARRFELAILTRDATLKFSNTRSRGPEWVRERYRYSVFKCSYQLSVISLTGGTVTVDRCPEQPLHAVRPEASAD